MEADSYEGNETIFTGMGIPKGNNEEFQGLSMGANRYEDKIKSIEISPARMRTPHEPLTEGDISISRTELGKLTRIARMARPELIYDSAAAAQVISNGEIINVSKKGGNFYDRRRN